jgi:hypothetical protein
MSQERKAIMARARAFMMKPPEERTKLDWLDIMEDVSHYNEIARATRIQAPLITPKSLRTNLKRAFKPPKRERVRAEYWARTKQYQE